MKCTRCYRRAEAIMCPSCYQQNCKHNEEGRKIIQKKYDDAVLAFQSYVNENLHLGNSLTVINRKTSMMHAQKAVDELLQTKYQLLQRKREQNRVLRQKILERKSYIQKLQYHTRNVSESIQPQQKEKRKLASRIYETCYEIKSEIESKFKILKRYIKQNSFTYTEDMWNKFINMEEQCQSMHIDLLDNNCQPEILRIYEQIKKQMIAVSIISQYLQIPLPYPMDFKDIRKKDANDLLFQEVKKRKRLNRLLLKHFQVNASYLFTRFGVKMDYPHISIESLGMFQSGFACKRFNIIDKISNFDSTKVIQISSEIEQLSEVVHTQSNSNTESIAMTMDGIKFELTAEGLMRHYYPKECSQIALEESTSQSVQCVEIIDLTSIISVYSSQDEIETL